MHAGNVRVAEIIVQPERSIRRHGDVIVHGVGGTAADSNHGEFGFRVNGADVYAVTGFADFNLNLLREVLGFGVRTSLHVNLCRNFQFATGISADVNLSEAVIEAEALIAG